MFTRASNWMIMLAFFTNTGLQRLFAMQMMLPGTSKVTTAFLMSLKTDLPEVNNSIFNIGKLVFFFN